MSSYYDSDDDVAWGPLTLREIKRTLKTPVTRIVDRRHTLVTPGSTDCKQKPIEMENPVTNDSISLSCALNKCNITSSSNEYYTPNVTVAEKTIVPIVNSPSTQKVCLNEITVASNVDFEETQIKFLNMAKNRNTDFDLKNVQQTLIECTVLNESSENEHKESSDEMHDSCIMKSLDSQNLEDDIIILSSDEDDDSFLTAKTRSYQNGPGNHNLVKKELANLEKSYKDYDYLTTEEIAVSNSSRDSHEQFDEMSNNDLESDFSEENISSDRILEKHFESGENITMGGERPRLHEDFSPIQVPKLDLAAFDESDDCLKLNDTLDDIERMLIAGNDDSQESQNTCSSSNLSSSYVASEPERTPNRVHIISGSFSQSPIYTNLDKAKTPSKTVVSVRKLTPRNFNSPSKLCEDLKTEKTTPTLNRKDEPVSKLPVPIGNFRIPKTPLKLKPTMLNNKNIVSPVGIYIKYSPQTPLTTYVKPNESKKGVAMSPIPQPQKVIKTNKENTDVLPPVVYQPAKTKLFTVQEELNLPASIEKMVKKSNVIKHEKRMNFGVHDEDSLQRKLNMESELTKNSISDSLLVENTQDISVLTSKQAFKK